MSNKQIDPRGPRFGAAITTVLLAIDVYLALDTNTLPTAFWLLTVITALFAIGAFFGNSRHPYGWIFKTFVRPRLAAPKELEDAAAPQFAQLIGLLVAGTGVVLYLVVSPGALVFAAGAAFFAAFLNAAFNYCLGCQIYFGLKRLRVIR
jgi:hypothetical protein